jgi:hypothetical protein
MQRREVLAGISSAIVTATAAAADIQQDSQARPNTYLELKTWRLHNSAEDQSRRVSEYLRNGLSPALTRAGAKLAGAFANVIGQDGPYYVTLAEYASLQVFQNVITALNSDAEHQRALEKLSSDGGVPFVRVDSTLMRSFDRMPQVAYPAAGESRGPARIFELRTYESQSFLTLRRKVAMFNRGEAAIFERLGMRPVFFGETIAGPRQPNLNYMLSYDDLAARDRLWGEFGKDPEWQKLRNEPGLSDAEIVLNISNVILRPLPFSLIR